MLSKHKTTIILTIFKDLQSETLRSYIANQYALINFKREKSKIDCFGFNDFKRQIKSNFKRDLKALTESDQKQLKAILNIIDLENAGTSDLNDLYYKILLNEVLKILKNYKKSF